MANRGHKKMVVACDGDPADDPAPELFFVLPGKLIVSCQGRLNGQDIGRLRPACRGGVRLPKLAAQGGVVPFVSVPVNEVIEVIEVEVLQLLHLPPDLELIRLGAGEGGALLDGEIVRLKAAGQVVQQPLFQNQLAGSFLCGHRWSFSYFVQR